MKRWVYTFVGILLILGVLASIPREPVSGWGDRGPEFTKWNCLTVRIDSTTCGTLIYYDKVWAYVVGSGHPFTNEKDVTIEVFYRDEQMLEPRAYKGELLLHEWDGGIHDISLSRFKPDWVPRVAGIAKRGFNPDPGRGNEINYHNSGCDGYTTPGHYSVRYLWRERRANGLEQLACEGKCRGGRSGGGLFTDDGTLIGITSRFDSTRIYYSSISQLYRIDAKYHFILVDNG